MTPNITEPNVKRFLLSNVPITTITHRTLVDRSTSKGKVCVIQCQLPTPDIAHLP
jgi:hypothetical protein